MEWENKQTAEEALEAIRETIEADPELSAAVQQLPAKTTLLNEGETSRQLHLILEGEVALHKASTSGRKILVDRLEAGDLLGILSYVARRHVYVSAVTATPVRTLVLSWEQFERLRSTHPDLQHRLQDLTVENLARRYRRMVRLHLDIATVNRDLEAERAELRLTLAELERTRNRLIHQEKLATLGQLIAGLAHELNNPVGALSRSVDYLRENIGQLIQAQGGETETALRLWESGLSSGTPDSEQRRRRMEAVSRRCPQLARPVVRRLSIVPEEILEMMFASFGGESRTVTEAKVLAGLLHFEAGYYLRSIGLGAERISNLVVSLRNYSRGGSGGTELVDVRSGIQDTLRIVGNRIKDLDTELRLEETPPVPGNSGELNQVWTNLIVNACDAMDDRGRLVIACGREGPDAVFVTVTDSGPGLPEELMEKIFEPNFTTKTNATHFGLGLGLAISREIIKKHGGELTVENAKEGGATFKAVLPAAPQE